MIRTRYIAGVCAALLATPFVLPQVASAADGTAAATGPFYVGDTASVTVTKGDASGAYEVFLYSGTTKVAKIGAGETIADSTVKWVIPAGVKQVLGDTMKIEVDPATGASFSTAAFAVKKAAITAVTIKNEADDAAAATGAQGGKVNLHWVNEGAVGNYVDVTLVPSDTKKKPIVIAENVPAADETYLATIPTTVAVATGYKFKVMPVSKDVDAALSGAFEVTAKTAPTAALEAKGGSTAVTSIKKGQAFDVKVTATSGDKVTLTLITKGDTKKKALAVISTTAETGDEVEFTFPSKLAAGDYSIIPSLTGSGGGVAGTAQDITLQDWAAITLDTDTTSDLGNGVTAGESVTVEWASTGNQNITVSLVGPTGKLTALDKEEKTVGGAGVYTWVSSSKLATGSYKIRVANSALKSTDTNAYVESSAFTLTANATTLVKATTTATTTTVAATTTTVAATTTTAA